MALLDREIHELPRASSVGDAALFPIEQDGEAQSMSFELLRSYLNRNVVSVVTVARQGTTSISTDFDEETGTLTIYVPAQMVDCYSKAEIDEMLAALTIPADRVIVSETQRLSGVLMYDIDEQRFVRLVCCSKTTYDSQELAGNRELDAMVFPYSPVSNSGT